MMHSKIYDMTIISNTKISALDRFVCWVFFQLERAVISWFLVLTHCIVPARTQVS